jgi:hypothetical protein
MKATKTMTRPLSQKKNPLSTRRVIFVPAQVYIEGSEDIRGQGSSFEVSLKAWRDLLSKGDPNWQYNVPSKSRKGMYHVVDLSDPDFPKCGCENFVSKCLTSDGEYITGKICRHIEKKAREILNAEKGRKRQ